MILIVKYVLDVMFILQCCASAILTRILEKLVLMLLAGMKNKNESYGPSFPMELELLSRK